MMVKIGDADSIGIRYLPLLQRTSVHALDLKTKTRNKTCICILYAIRSSGLKYTHGANSAANVADSSLNEINSERTFSAIAASSAESAELLVQEEPITASYLSPPQRSTISDVDKVVKIKNRKEIIRLKTAEVQLDAAIDLSVLSASTTKASS